MDAIDNVTGKIAIIEKAVHEGVPVISSMGTGNKMDPSAFRITVIEKTRVCPLARVMRRELRSRGIKGVKVLYSEEERSECRRAPCRAAFPSFRPQRV